MGQQKKVTLGKEWLIQNTSIKSINKILQSIWWKVWTLYSKPTNQDLESTQSFCATNEREYL